jgi:hypothetical protein
MCSRCYTFEAAQIHLVDVFHGARSWSTLLFRQYSTEDDGEMEYVTTEANAQGAVAMKSEVKRVEVRARAVEVRRDEAILLRQRAQQLWPESEWEIEKTYSGKYVVRSY